MFFTFPNIYANSGMGKFKAERRMRLERDLLKILVRKFHHCCPSVKLCIFDFSFTFITLITSVNQSYEFFVHTVSQIVPIFFSWHH